MADKLLFKGAKHISKREGNEMQLVRPRRGGDTHQVARWWNKGSMVVYVTCQVLRVQTTTRGVLRLVIPLAGKESTKLWIIHDGNAGFSFLDDRIGIDRVGVFSDDMATFYQEYQFSKISGGATLLRTVNPLPTDWQIGTITLSGPANAEGGTTQTYTAANDGNADDVVYALSSSNVADTISGMDVTFADAAGTSVLTVTGTSALAAGASATDSLSVAVTESLSSRIANATYSYTISVVNIAADPVNDPAENVYSFTPTTFGANQPSLTATVGESIAFDFSAVASSHPLGIFTDASKTTPVTVGVENGGTGNATLLFTPPIAGSFSYQCINHANMGGDLTVS